MLYKDEGNSSDILVQRLRKHLRTSVMLPQDLTTRTRFRFSSWAVALVPVLELMANT